MFVFRRCAILAGCAVIETASAQFIPAFLQNASYWTPPKSEFDFYNAELARDGQVHSAELLMIFTPGFADPASFAPVDNAKQPGAVPVIRMQQMVTAPRGIVLEQRSINATWRMDFMALAQLSFVGSDGFGNTSKSVTEKRSDKAVTWNYACGSPCACAGQQEITPPNAAALMYEELPLRVRTIDFSKGSGESDFQLAPALERANHEFGQFEPAKISWKTVAETIEVDVTHDGGKDHFVLDRDFPFLLREWRMADGSRLRMKNSLRVDYREYLKNGDRERALKDPMLRHPD